MTNNNHIFEQQQITLISENSRKLNAIWYENQVVESRNIAIIFFHGIGSDLREFGDFPKLLAEQGFSCLLHDSSGHGSSNGEKGFLSEKIYLEDIKTCVDWVKNNNYNDIYLFGHSFGANAALLGLIKNQSVNGAIVIALQQKSGDSLKGIKKILFKMMGLFYKYFNFVPGFLLNNKTKYNDIFTSDAEIQSAKNIGFISDKLNLKICSYANNIDNISNVKKINKPILFIACELDKQIPFNKIKRLYEECLSKKKEFYILPNTGHSPFFSKNIKMLADKISNFLNTQNI